MLGLLVEFDSENKRESRTVHQGQIQLCLLDVVVKEVEIFNHEFDDLRVVAYIRAVSAILCRLQLDEASLSFLVPVSDDLARLKA